MNERIKQLAADCGLYIAYDNREVTGKELEYFAELIVQECARVAIATPCPITDEVSLQSQGHTWDMATIEAARSIKQHFESQR